MRRRALDALFVLALAAAGCREESPPAPPAAVEEGGSAERTLPAGASELYDEGEALRRDMRLEEAEEVFTRLLESHPGHHLAQLSLARVRYRRSDPSTALALFDAYFNAASADEPTYEAALLEHGRALRAAGRHQEAADRFALALALDPMEADAYSELAQSLFRLKLRREGKLISGIYQALSQGAFEEHVERRLRETGQMVFALGQEAFNCTRKRRFLKALESYRRALALEEKDVRVAILFADLLFQLRRPSEARGVIDTALGWGLKPRSGLVWTRARLSFEGRRVAEEEGARAALPDLEEARRLLAAEGDLGGTERGQAPAFTVLLSLARARLLTGDAAGAAPDAEAAARLAPAAWEPLLWRGRALHASGDAAGALGLFATALERVGESPPHDVFHLFHARAAALEGEGRREEARRDIEECLRRAPAFLPAREALVRLLGESPEAAAERATLARLRESHAALAALEAAVDGTPLERSGEAYVELGKRLQDLRDPGASDCYFLASDLLPASREVLELLLAGLRRQEDVFIRVHLLRRLVALEAAAGISGDAAGQLAAIYLQLHVLLEEAEGLARALHAGTPSSRTYRLLAALLEARGRRAEGRALLEEALARYPGDEAVRAALSALSAPAAPSAPSAPSAAEPTSEGGKEGGKP